MNKTQTLALVWAQGRFASGWRPSKLLTRENVKLKKAWKKDWRGMGLSLSPAKTSGFEVCASRTESCTEFCLHETGRGQPHMTFKDGLHQVWASRLLRTIWFFRDRESFMEALVKDIARNQDAAIRLNVLSDWIWERQTVTVSEKVADRYGLVAGRHRNLFEVFPDVQFYDYTKHYKRMFRDLPSNYHLTFSLNESNENQARDVLNAGHNIAAIVRDPSGTLFGRPVIDGDDHDLRFLDPKNVVVGLRPKGALNKTQGKGLIYDTQPITGASMAA